MADSDSINIRAKAIPDFKDFNRELDKIGKKGRKGIPLSVNPSGGGGGGRGGAFGGGGRGGNRRKSGSKDKQESAASKYASGGSLASKSGADGSDLDETQRGGFHGVIDRKISAGRELKDGFWKKKENEQDEKEKSPGTTKLGLGTGQGIQLQKAEIKIQHADFGKGALPGIGGGGGTPVSATPGTDAAGVRGGNTSALGGSIPFIGAALALAGGALKIISAVGEQYHAAMQSQQSTIGATGGYVGGGGQYFANADIAQANVARGRVTGENIYGKGSLVDEQTMKFAASQGKGIAEVVKELETIRKESKNADIGFLRGGANASGFSGLRQSEYISKLSALSESLRGRGFSGDINDYSRFSAGIDRTDGIKMDPSRRMALAEQLSDQGRQGAFGGGIFGSLSMAEALKANQGDTLKAIRDSELNPGKYMTSALGGLDGTTRGIINKMQGGSFAEMESLKFGSGDFRSDNSNIQAGSNQSLGLDNDKKQAFAGEAGYAAAQIGYDMNKAMIDLFKTNQKAMSDLAGVIHNIEKAAIPMIAEPITNLTTTINEFAHGEFGKGFKSLFGSVTDLIGITSPNGLLVRSK